MSLKDDLKKIYDVSDDMSDVINFTPGLVYEVVNEFFGEVIGELSEKLKSFDKDREVNICGDLSKKHGFPFRIYKKEWKDKDSKNYMLFGFEFSGDDYWRGEFGIVRINENINIEKCIEDCFEDMDSIKAKCGLQKIPYSEWWFLKDRIFGCEDDFAKEIVNGYTPEKFVNMVFDCIKKIEIDKGIVSDINEHLRGEK